MDIKKVNAGVKVAISIDKNKAAIQRLSQDLARIYKTMNSEERDEYQKRIL